MKRIYLFCMGIMSVGAVHAQITLNSNDHYPNIGDNYGFIYTQNPILNVTNNGANQTWDLSGLNSGNPEPFSYANTNSGVDAANYPTATLLENVSGAENYYKKNANEVTFVGTYLHGTARLTYSDDRELLKFPLTFNSQFNETFSGTVYGMSVGQSLLREGTISILGSGYGDLTLPYATVNNVLKVTIITNYSDVYLGITIANYSDTMSLWFSATHNTYIATVSVATQDGSLTDYRASYLQESDFILSTHSVQANSSELSFYPNPAHTQITLTNIKNVDQITILDMKGVAVKKESVVSENQTVDISNLPKGLYFIQYHSGSQVITEKMVVN